LARQGCEARSVDSGRAALQVRDYADMVLLTLELPDLDGVEVCRGIRTSSDVPIIALTAGSSQLDRLLAIQAGADDCLVKPYSHHELLIRMQSILRRMRVSFARMCEISLGPLLIDPSSRQVRLRGRLVMLTRKEFDLLHLLASQPGTVVSRKELMAKVWEDDWAASDRTIDTHVSTLRSKLGDRSWIVTVRGIGYRLGAAGETVGCGPA
jgi:DNA-binding response OmpR family regulator